MRKSTTLQAQYSITTTDEDLFFKSQKNLGFFGTRHEKCTILTNDGSRDLNGSKAGVAGFWGSDHVSQHNSSRHCDAIFLLECMPHFAKIAHITYTVE